MNLIIDNLIWLDGRQVFTIVLRHVNLYCNSYPPPQRPSSHFSSFAITLC